MFVLGFCFFVLEVRLIFQQEVCQLVDTEYLILHDIILISISPQHMFFCSFFYIRLFCFIPCRETAFSVNRNPWFHSLNGHCFSEKKIKIGEPCKPFSGLACGAHVVHHDPWIMKSKCKIHMRSTYTQNLESI